MALVFKEDVGKLWRNYARQPSLDLRNKLLEMYLPIVKFSAERIRTKLPDEVEVDDLMSAGIFGLMDAIDSFDLGRGVKFETYCAPRIRGAILDELRSMDWVPRLVRSRAAKLDATVRALESELGRKPSVKEVAAHLGLSEREFAKLHREASAVSLVSLSRKYYETDSSRDVREIDLLQDRESLDPGEEVLKRDVKMVLSERLTRIEQLVLVMYYHEQMTMKEIGRTLNLSESRVSQMHSAILERIKVMIDTKHAGILSEVLAHA